ncbi:MAG: hypothetical protein M1118_00145 [Chloroflexi bacterium]|nr:hypothetical protein [Chloroflexota bacterium]
MRTLQRREFLTLGAGVLAGSAILAACSSSTSAATATAPATVTQTVTETLSQAAATAAAQTETVTNTVTETVTQTASPATVTATASASGPAEASLYLSVVTGGMIGKKGWPAFLPTDVTVPANTRVNVTIYNFDDGTAPLPAGMATYAKVTGTVGGDASWEPLKKDDPNAGGTPKTFQSLNPKDVSHTFTVSDLQLNVPFPVSAVVNFSFDSGKAGTYAFKCLAPCGSGPDGMQGAMMTKGYMIGTLKVV